MTLTLELAPDVERVLEARARRRGLPLAAYILDLAQRDAKAECGAEGEASDLFCRLLNDSTHNDAILELATAPEEVRAIVIQRSSDAGAGYYNSSDGQAESEDLLEWRALDDEAFEDDETHKPGRCPSNASKPGWAW